MPISADREACCADSHLCSHADFRDEPAPDSTLIGGLQSIRDLVLCRFVRNSSV
jgi:hypothetical protein